jgi:hypothetical protein
MFILIAPHVWHFSDGNQTVSNVKKKSYQNNVNGVYFENFQTLLDKYQIIFSIV